MTLTAVYLLHLLSGVVWTGGVIFTGLILYPALARLPAAEAEALLARTGPRSAAVMGVAGLLVLISGPLRAWQSGGIRGWGDLTTGYGLIVTLAFALAVAVPGFDGSFRKRLRGLMADPGAYARQAPALARLNALVVCTGFGLILLLMAMLGTGAY